MALPQPDSAETLALVRLMAATDRDCRQDLRRYLDGVSSMVNNLPTIRRHVRRLIEDPGGTHVSRPLRTALTEWASKYSTNTHWTKLEAPMTEAVAYRVTARMLIELKAAARRAGVKPGEYARQALERALILDRPVQEG